MPPAAPLCSSQRVKHALANVRGSTAPSAIVVLGCKVSGGAPGAALERRLSRARDLWTETSLPVILAGGRLWGEITEARAMHEWWSAQVSADSVVFREEISMTTGGNAFYTAQICRQESVTSVYLVTCDYHMRRARRLFERAGLLVSPIEARSPHEKFKRLKLLFREWGASVLGRWEKFP